MNTSQGLRHLWLKPLAAARRHGVMASWRHGVMASSSQGLRMDCIYRIYEILKYRHALRSIKQRKRKPISLLIKPELANALHRLRTVTNGQSVSRESGDLLIDALLNPDLPLNVTEYDEWGDPPILAVAGYNDSRVPYWEAAKWVAKLRRDKTGDNLLLLKTDLGAGHGGMSGRYQGIKDVALEYAFIFKVLRYCKD